jgi:hypothetical protein
MGTGGGRIRDIAPRRWQERGDSVANWPRNPVRGWPDAWPIARSSKHLRLVAAPVPRGQGKWCSWSCSRPQPGSGSLGTFRAANGKSGDRCCAAARFTRKQNFQWVRPRIRHANADLRPALRAGVELAGWATPPSGEDWRLDDPALGGRAPVRRPSGRHLGAPAAQGGASGEAAELDA